jgi:nucleoid DNA-binding protein
VSAILNEYVGYLKSKIQQGESVKFLNVCYLIVDDKEIGEQETLAYISNEVGKKVGQTQTVAFRVLTCFEDVLVRELRKLNNVTVCGLVRFRLEKNYKNEYRVRSKKSTTYNNLPIRVSTLPSFKRKVEVLGT